MKAKVSQSKWGIGLSLLLIVGLALLLYLFYIKYVRKRQQVSLLGDELTALGQDYDLDDKSQSKRWRNSFSNSSLGDVDDEDPDELIRWAESNLR